MRTALVPVLALALSACVTTFEGERPSALYGQHLDAAIALYGPWEERLDVEGKTYYLWRRSAKLASGEVMCELRLEVTPKHIIARRLMQGFPEACNLFMAQLVPLERQ